MTAAPGGPRDRIIAGLMYLLAVASMALVGLLSPLAPRVTADLGAPVAAIGLTIALFSLPAAIVATVGGGIVDRVGARVILIGAPLLIVLGDAVLLAARGIWLFDLGMLVVGAGFVCIVVGAPAMMIGAFEGGFRTRVMAFWPTYGAIGFSCGLLLAVPFTGGLDWRIGIALHAIVMLLIAAGLAATLPRRARVPHSAASGGIGQLFAIMRDVPALRLAVAMAMPNMISYGTSLIAATYIARVHGLSLAASATAVAVAKIAAMLLGGTVIGALLARDLPPRRLFAIAVVGGGIAQLLLYLPQSPLPLAIAALMAWLFAYGGACGVCMATMAALSGGGARGGAVAGLVNQFVSLASFLTPTIYFALSGWQGFVGVAIAGLALAMAMLPAPRAAALA